MKRDSRSLASMGTGSTFSPLSRTMVSLERPRIFRQSLNVTMPRSPVFIHPSLSTFSVASGFL